MCKSQVHVLRRIPHMSQHFYLNQLIHFLNTQFLKVSYANQERRVNYSNFQAFFPRICRKNSHRLKAIICPSGYLIHVYAAYFGIQYSTSSMCYKSSNEMPEKCYFPSVFNQINSTCEYQNTCSLTSTSDAFSIIDPCPNYSKQLFIQYQCVEIKTLKNSSMSKCNADSSIPLICPALSVDTSILEATACDTDNSPMKLSCPSEKTITIICAYYGLHPALTKCTYSSNVPVCYFKSSFTMVNTTCSGQQSCSITFLNTFTDPCHGMNKALYVQYSCS
jgi:hypothetical protein